MKNRASILIIALWVLFLLSAFAVMLGVQVRQKLVLVKRIEARNKLLAVAEAGLEQARLLIIQQPEDLQFHCLKDAWSSNVYLFQNKAFGDGFYSVYADIPGDGNASPAVRRYGMIDEESKLNLNTIGPEDIDVLRRLCQVVLNLDETQALNLAASVFDWKDEDSVLAIPSGSAEDPYYHSLPAGYDAKDKPFDILEELLLVKGFDQTVLGALRPYITIYGSGKVNINTAGRPVLLALGLTDAQVSAIIEYRQGKDGAEGTADDGIFDSLDSVPDKISLLLALTPEQVSEVSSIIGRFCSLRSTAFSIRSQSAFGKGSGQAQVECVVDNKAAIVYYHQQ